MIRHCLRTNPYNLDSPLALVLAEVLMELELMELELVLVEALVEVELLVLAFPMYTLSIPDISPMYTFPPMSEWHRRCSTSRTLRLEELEVVVEEG